MIEKENFFTNEFNILANRRAELVKQIINTERYSVVLSSVVCWLIMTEETIQNDFVSLIIATLPIFLCLIGAMRSYGLNRDIHIIDDYILNQEEKCLSQEIIGFEHFKKKQKNKGKTILGLSAWIFWPLIGAINLFLFIRCVITY